MKAPVISSTREAVIAALIETARKDPDIVLVSADSLKAARATVFAEEFSERVFEVGIAEQTAVAFAAGLASCGLKPFVITYAGFITMRACEQVRTFVGYTGLNVKLVGLNGGIFGGEREGVTHQFFEDLGIMRTIPGMDIVVPADASQAKKATLALAGRSGPGYLRIGSGREPVILDETAPFDFGACRMMADHGTEAVLFSNGPILRRVLAAAEGLAASGMGVRVVEVHTLKPIDRDGILSALRPCSTVLTIEDHSIIGGLGSAVAEVMAESGTGKPLVRMGLQDEFPRSGAAEEILDCYGLSVGDIVETVRHAVRRKGGTP